MIFTSLYVYGSRQYGTHRHDSDHDMIATLSSTPPLEMFETGNLTIHLYDEATFQRQVDAHCLPALECLFQDGLIPHEWSFTLDKNKLRCDVSARVSNSWAKFKKKINLHDDHYRGVKSLFHCYRMLDFGIQIAETGRIHDYSSANHYWDDIQDFVNEHGVSVPDLDDRFRPGLWELRSKFKKLCPK